jgi:hypothetical protein
LIKKQHKKGPLHSINGYKNVLKNLRIYRESDSDVSYTDPIKNMSIVDTAVNVSRADSDDFILSNSLNVRIITDVSNSGENSSWNYNISESHMGKGIFDTTKDHVFVSYVKRLSENPNDKGEIIFGPTGAYGSAPIPVNENVDIRDGSFSSINTIDLVSNEWYLMVGVLRGKGFINGNVSIATGVHRLSNRKKVSSIHTDYMLVDDSLSIGVSTGFINDSNSVSPISNEQLNTKVSFTKPFIFEVDNATDSIVNGIVETMLGVKK